MQIIKDTKLAMHIRVVMGISAIPSLMLASMIFILASNGRFAEISYFEWIYSFTGFIAIT